MEVPPAFWARPQMKQGQSWQNPFSRSRFRTNLLRDICSLIVSLNRTSTVVSKLVKRWAKIQVRNYSKQIIEGYNEVYSRFDAIDCSDDSN